MPCLGSAKPIACDATGGSDLDSAAGSGSLDRRGRRHARRTGRRQIWFTGQVWMDEFGILPGLGVRALRVTFSPGARTAWHAHPGGQVLHVVDGVGRVQTVWAQHVSDGDYLADPA